MQSIIARQAARTLEVYHTFIYRAPEALAAYRRIGLDDGPMSYFAPRAAPLGTASPELVTSTFFNFSPRRVRSVIPEAWRRASPVTVLAARFEGADAGLRQLLGPALDSPAVAEAAELARRAAGAGQLEGRPLYAAHAGVPYPEAPHVALWHAITQLREYRTDSHYIALLANGIGAIDAIVLDAATGGRPRSFTQPSRAWSDEDWAASTERLATQGWVDAQGNATEAGRDFRARLETETDVLSLAPWRALGADGTERLRDLVRPLTSAIVAAGVIPNRTALNDD